jgi:tetratricopeptide (TPR) repeat protein
VIYQRVGAIEPEDERCAAATVTADVIRNQADEQFTAIESLLETDAPIEAVKKLAAYNKRYEGSDLAERGLAKLAELRSDPQTQAMIEQQMIDQRADALEAKALAVEKKQNYDDALRLYESYVKQYEQATRFVEVKEHYEVLQNDPAVARAVRDQKAERQCKGQLAMAKNYIAADIPDKARRLLEEIIADHPDTTWAERAQVMLDELP